MIKSKILVVEDDNDTQKFLKLFLSKEFEIELCHSGITFLELVKNKRFDLILLDISLREGNTGLMLTKKIKSIEEFKNIPVICLSSHIFNTDRKNAYETCIDMFLTKPVRNDILLHSINSFINSKSEQKTYETIN
jgi:DNA-binding response OmpR family regulator